LPVRVSLCGRAITLALLVALAAGWACAAPADAPPLPRHANAPADFAPPGWYAERLERADFNRDGRRDVLLLLRRRAEPGAADPLARILAVALRRPNGYALAFENASLIPRLDPPYGEDPLADGELTMVNRGFRIKLSAFASAGSYAMANLSFAFRLRDGCFRLVAYERTEVNRATLDTVETTVDYVGGRLKERRGNEQSNSATTRMERIRPFRTCAEEVGNAWTFDPVGEAHKR